MNTNNLTQAEKIDYILNVMNKKKNKALTNNQINEYIDNVFNTVNKIEKENKKEKKVEFLFQSVGDISQLKKQLYHKSLHFS